MDSNNYNKTTLIGELRSVASVDNYGAPLFGLPAPSVRQRDIQYILAIFVSSGMNLNGAYFLPSELIQARDTIIGKPLDVEHLENYVVGTIYDRAFMLKDKTVIDPVAFMVGSGNTLDKQEIDIAVLMGLFKYRFPEVAQEVDAGKYKVSMECYYEDFDLKVGDMIISKNEASGIGINFASKDASLVGKTIKIVDGSKELGFTKVGRVFRNILFSGCGLVEIPANPPSVILETAASTITNEVLTDVTVDLSKSETYNKQKYEANKCEVSLQTEENLMIHTEEAKCKVPAPVKEAAQLGLDLYTSKVCKVPEECIENATALCKNEEVDFERVERMNAFFAKCMPKKKDEDAGWCDEEEPSDDWVEWLMYGGDHGSAWSEAVCKTKKYMDKGSAVVGTEEVAYGRPSSSNPGTCVNFKKYVYEYMPPQDNATTPEGELKPQLPNIPGVGDTPTQFDFITKTHWCGLFNAECTVLAGDATDPRCLRNVLDRSVTDVVGSALGLMELIHGDESLVSNIRKSIDKATTLLDTLYKV